MASSLNGYAFGNTTKEIEETAASAITAKAIAMTCLFLLSFLMGILPLKLSKWFNWHSDGKSKEIVSLLLCFGGGVLLCTTFLHLLPEVASSIAELQEQGLLPKSKIHFAELLMCTGFFVMYFVEECVHVYLHKREKNNELKTLSRTLSIRRGEMENESDENLNLSSNFVKGDLESVKSNIVINSDAHQNNHSHNHKGHSHIVIEEEDSVVKNLRGLLVVFALSIHELFEGLAVGLESSASTVWYMFSAVSAHKFVIAFCIGVELVSTKTKTYLTVIYVFTFSIVSAMGIGIGILVSADDQGSTTLVSSVLQGIATGTLLYVVFFEILQKDNTGGGIKCYFSIFLGFLIMFGITVVGIGIGIILSKAGGSEEDVTSVILQGMAAGTLLYVVFFEVLARERSNKHSGFWQLIAILAGFGVMFGLQYLTGHEHGAGEIGHSHHGPHELHFH